MLIDFPKSFKNTQTLELTPENIEAYWLEVKELLGPHDDGESYRLKAYAQSIMDRVFQC